MGNHLLPMALVLLMMKWLEGEKRPALLFALTAFVAALCMETVTIWLAAAAAALFVSLPLLKTVLSMVTGLL